ncbi:unnamed protein product [Durusdinium trenchii]|uniref:Uncharacterized protein n=1 Tax=Durusdinium trenchii TaxID=1381693 RepID=A0ABP0LN20_9DINO
MCCVVCRLVRVAALFQACLARTCFKAPASANGWYGIQWREHPYVGTGSYFDSVSFTAMTCTMGVYVNWIEYPNSGWDLSKDEHGASPRCSGQVSPNQNSTITCGKTGLHYTVHPAVWGECSRAEICDVQGVSHLQLITGTQVDYEWSPGEWTTCSETCGPGTKTRSVLCSPEDPGYCHQNEKPSTTDDCNLASCQWEIQSWGACSHLCGGGERNRNVTCPRDDSFCIGTKPDTTEACNEQLCEWDVQNWSACSQDCGGGERNRTVTCPRDDSYCIGTKPDTTEACNEQNCSTTTEAFAGEADDPSSTTSTFATATGTTLSSRATTASEEAPGQRQGLNEVLVAGLAIAGLIAAGIVVYCCHRCCRPDAACCCHCKKQEDDVVKAPGQEPVVVKEKRRARSGAGDTDSSRLDRQLTALVPDDVIVTVDKDDRESTPTPDDRVADSKDFEFSSVTEIQAGGMQKLGVVVQEHFDYEELAKDALFLVSGTTTLDAGTLKKINAERLKNGEKELPDAINVQQQMHEIEARGFQVLGCGVGDDGSLLREGVPLQEVRTGWARRRCTKPLISDQDLRLKCGMGKNDDNEDRWLVHYRHYSEKTKCGVLILAGSVDFFRLWAASDACRREVAEVPDGRLFAYIDGIVIRVNSPKPEKLWASAKAGPGYIVWSNGELYSGPLKNSQPHGKGTHYFENGDFFEGDFRDGQIHGKNGTHFYENGSKLEGTWASGKAVLATCTYHFVDGTKFTGQWPKEQMNAKSVQEHVLYQPPCCTLTFPMFWRQICPVNSDALPSVMDQ